MTLKSVAVEKISGLYAAVYPGGFSVSLTILRRPLPRRSMYFMRWNGSAITGLATLNGYFVASKTIRKIKTENTFLDGTAVDSEKNVSMIQLFHIFATSLPNGSDRIGSQNKALRGAMRDV